MSSSPSSVASGSSRASGASAPTIQTVAERAGVSRQTVSNVLNAPERVLPQTRMRVQQAIDELRYRPNRLASALQSRTTRAVGYRLHISEEQDNLLLDRFLHDLCRAAALRQHQIVLISPTDLDDEVATYDEIYRTGTVDGIVISGSFPGDRRLDFLLDNRIPAVSFGRNWDRPDVGGWVDIDGAAAIVEAVQHFVRLGHRAIAWIGETQGGAESDRRDGYRAAIDASAMDRIELVCGATIDDATDAASVALRSSTPPTAFVCSTDVAAVGCARAAIGAGLKIGTELGIIGFDDTRLALAMWPQLSSIRQPTEQVAQLLIDGLIETVATGVAMRAELLTPRLIHRGSS